MKEAQVSPTLEWPKQRLLGWVLVAGVLFSCFLLRKGVWQVGMKASRLRSVPTGHSVLSTRWQC